MMKVDGSLVKFFSRSMKRWAVAGKVHKHTFVKHISDPKQQLHTPPAFCLDQEIWQWVEQQKTLKYILVKCDYDGTQYIASIKHFREKLMFINRGNAGPQVCLVMSDWKTPEQFKQGDVQFPKFPLFGKPHKCKYDYVVHITGKHRRCIHCGEFPPTPPKQKKRQRRSL